jgi:serine phosphatase RsbU (regulator of sigma subunit)
LRYRGWTGLRRNGKEEYRRKRLRGKIKDLGDKPVQEIAADLFADGRAFTGGRAQRDDITLVAVKRTL